MTGKSGSRVDRDRSTLLLRASDVERLISVTDVIELVADALRAMVSGGIESAPRVGVADNSTLLMAAAAAQRGVAAKLVSIRPANRDRGLATISGVAIWLDYATRAPLLVADAGAVTALRTGALSGAATRVLAAPQASVLAMVGAGGQALRQVEAVCAVRPIRQIRVVSTGSSALDLRDRLQQTMPSVEIRVSVDIGQAVRGADVICVATTATSALLEADSVGADSHVNAIGAYRPDMKELGLSLLRAAGLVCADNRAGALSEAGDLLAAIEADALPATSILELGSIVDGAWADGGRPGGPTVFKSVGVAAADFALLEALHGRAREDEEVSDFQFTA